MNILNINTKWHLILIILTILITILYYNKFEYEGYDCSITTTYLSYIVLPILLLNTHEIYSSLFIIFIFTWHSLHHYYKIIDKNKYNK